MCGIAACFEGTYSAQLPDWPFRSASSCVDSDRFPPVSELRSALERRGPDSTGEEYIRLSPFGASGSSDPSLTLLGTTLSLRHDSPPQHPLPLACDDPAFGSPFLLYNGELYDVPATEGATCGSDTLYLASILRPLWQGKSTDPTLCEREVLEKLDSLRGPFAFFLWVPSISRLYFARDVLGRRSLLILSRPGVGTVLSSVAPKGYENGFVEVPPIGLCSMQFSFSNLSPSSCSSLADGRSPPGNISCIFRATKRACRSVVPRGPRSVSTKKVLQHASLADRCDPLDMSFLPVGLTRCGSDSIDEARLSIEGCVALFVSKLEESVSRRLVVNVNNCHSENSDLDGRSSTFAVLFSGGVDSMVIAMILDRILPSDERIDLVNVAFGIDDRGCGLCPDRLSGIEGYHELESAGSSGRIWRLICVDMLHEKADFVATEHVRHLVYPCEQPMDFAIGCAIWAAAQCQGSIHVDADTKACSASAFVEKPSISTGCPLETAEVKCADGLVASEARVLFSGLGADELMAGYKGRHRTSFSLGGDDAVSRAIDGDLGRLWYRNLGRDDRLISDSGREVRHPFLDEDLISFVCSLPLQPYVCNLSLDDGVGDKLLLRRAASQLGLPPSASNRCKRAIQFGSRSKHVLERSRKS